MTTVLLSTDGAIGGYGALIGLNVRTVYNTIKYMWYMFLY